MRAFLSTYRHVHNIPRPQSVRCKLQYARVRAYHQIFAQYHCCFNGSRFKYQYILSGTEKTCKYLTESSHAQLPASSIYVTSKN